MKKFVIAYLLLLFIMSPVFISTAKAEEKGASEQAHERANKNAIFNRISDWFSTVGKSGEEKEKILEERKIERAGKRAEKEAKKAQKKAEKEASKAQKEASKAQKEVEKKGSGKRENKQ